MNNRQFMWDELTRNYYKLFLQERILDALVSRWETFDLVVKLVVAITATGSVVSGWIIWEMTEFRWIWISITSIAAITSIFSSTASVSQILREANRVYPNLTEMRVRFEAIMFQFKLEEIPVCPETTQNINNLIQQTHKTLAEVPRFPFVRDGFIIEQQKELNNHLKSLNIIS